MVARRRTRRGIQRIRSEVNKILHEAQNCARVRGCVRAQERKKEGDEEGREQGGAKKRKKRRRRRGKGVERNEGLG